MQLIPVQDSIKTVGYLELRIKREVVTNKTNSVVVYVMNE